MDHARIRRQVGCVVPKGNQGNGEFEVAIHATVDSKNERREMEYRKPFGRYVIPLDVTTHDRQPFGYCRVLPSASSSGLPDGKD